jgi:hypothetical protein
MGDIITVVKSAYTTGKTIYDATKSGGQAGIAATTVTKTTDPYARCSKNTGLALSQCRAQVNREISLRAVGQAQTAMGPAKIPTASTTGTIVTVGVVAVIGAAIWFML